MQNITSYTVIPALPEKLARLKDLSLNLYWSWVDEIIQLFRRLDVQLWESTGHNPVLMLGNVSQRKLETLATNGSFLAHLDRAWERLDSYLHEETWFGKNYGDLKDFNVAYFSAEFGITECLPIYSGGLGLLAGDHLKSASDLGLPLIGVGLLYQQGYFRQYLNIDGWQQESYPNNDFYNLPIKLVKNDKNEPLTIYVDFPGRKVYAQIWLAQVGRIPLYLLDTNIPLNNKQDQDITDQLYGGDSEIRIQQEIILGIGGVKALKALGITPKVCHMNEGHSAFLGLERIRELVSEKGLKPNEASVAMSPRNVFTTHTPVEAGIDQFHPNLVEKYFSEYYKSLKIEYSDLFGLGRQNPNDMTEPFNMAYLALTLSAYHNGVSRLHGEVSRNMWQKRWPQLPVSEVPINYVTNGVHSRSWISSDMKGLLYRYLGPTWREDPSDQSIWENVEQIPAEELWNTHERRRERLVAFARRRLKQQLIKRGASTHEIDLADEILNPSALTIGFARRFATYKRGNLILRDRERLKRLLMDNDNQLQFIIAGKAHPKDDAGKDIIRQIVHFSRDPEVRKRIVFIEDYDMVVARYMVQGVDVWLNNPRRPMEASGTSGMKAAANGVLNLSILDGWWIEGFEIDPNVGWAIGKGEDYTDFNYQDDVEANALYDLLEKEIIPLFYDRGSDNLPRGWINKMKCTLRRLAPIFNTNRMVQEYTEKCYLPSYNRSEKMTLNNFERARKLASWKNDVQKHWKDIKIEKVQCGNSKDLPIGKDLAVEAWINLGTLKPKAINVEIYFGVLDENRKIINGNTVKMEVEGNKDGVHHYIGNIECTNSGLHGFTIRILPFHEDLGNPYELHLIHWQ
jgi:glycogen phosphorylase